MLKALGLLQLRFLRMSYLELEEVITNALVFRFEWVCLSQHLNFVLVGLLLLLLLHHGHYNIVLRDIRYDELSWRIMIERLLLHDLRLKASYRCRELLSRVWLVRLVQLAV